MSVIVHGEYPKRGCCGCHFRTGDFCGILEHNEKVKEYAERYARSPFCPLTELIQCKACKWYKADEYEADYGDCTNDTGMCNAFVYGNDYCSQAEHRGEG